MWHGKRIGRLSTVSKSELLGMRRREKKSLHSVQGVVEGAFSEDKSPAAARSNNQSSFYPISLLLVTRAVPGRLF